MENGEKRAVDTQIYTASEIERIARVAFDLAQKRRNKVSSAEKHNVMKTGVLWKQVVTRVRTDEFPRSSWNMCSRTTAPCSWCGGRNSTT